MWKHLEVRYPCVQCKFDWIIETLIQSQKYSPWPQWPLDLQVILKIYSCIAWTGCSSSIKNELGFFFIWIVLEEGLLNIKDSVVCVYTAVHVNQLGYQASLQGSKFFPIYFGFTHVSSQALLHVLLHGSAVKILKRPAGLILFLRL